MLLSMMINVHGISIYHCILHLPEDQGKGKNVRDFSLNLYLLMTKNETASLEKLPNFGILNFESCYGGGYFFTVALTICLLKKPRYDENQAQFYDASFWF